MTKFTKILFAALVGLSVGVARAEVDNKALSAIRDIQLGTDNANQIKTLRVQTEVVLPDSSIVTSVISNKAVTGVKLADSVVSQYDSANTTTTSLYTASSIGQILFGKTGGSGRVWRASALTATNWVQVYP